MNRSNLINVSELAQQLGISIHTVYAWVAQGRLPYVKLGSRTVFDPNTIEKWVQDRERAPQATPDEEQHRPA